MIINIFKSIMKFIKLILLRKNTLLFPYRNMLTKSFNPFFLFLSISKFVPFCLTDMIKKEFILSKFKRLVKISTKVQKNEIFISIPTFFFFHSSPLSSFLFVTFLPKLEFFFFSGWIIKAFLAANIRKRKSEGYKEREGEEKNELDLVDSTKWHTEALNTNINDTFSFLWMMMNSLQNLKSKNRF